MSSNLKLILVDINRGMCQAWEAAFDDLSDVTIAHGRFESLPRFDCMVSAANSFGLMDGGVDLAITRFFGMQLMRRVQERIINEWRGEQPVGTSMLVETGHEAHPFIAHTPTMRTPLDIRHTDNPYLAMWAMLNAVHRHNQAYNHSDEGFIEFVACPGLGTATGRMPFTEAARQMALAWQNFRNPPRSIDWGYAEARQKAIRYGGYDGFRYPME